jgi:hypothetical protein
MAVNLGCVWLKQYSGVAVVVAVLASAVLVPSVAASGADLVIERISLGNNRVKAVG